MVAPPSSGCGGGEHAARGAGGAHGSPGAAGRASSALPAFDVHGYGPWTSSSPPRVPAGSSVVGGTRRVRRTGCNRPNRFSWPPAPPCRRWPTRWSHGHTPRWRGEGVGDQALAASPWPDSTGLITDTLAPPPWVCDRGTTASATVGRAAPVATKTDWDGCSRCGARAPASISPTTGKNHRVPLGGDGDVHGPYRVPVDRSLIEGRQRRGRHHLLRAQQTVCLGDRHPHRGRRLRGRQHPLQLLGDRPHRIAPAIDGSTVPGSDDPLIRARRRRRGNGRVAHGRQP